MKPRILVIAGLGLAVLIVAAAVVLNLLPGQQASGPVAGPSSSQSEKALSPGASPTNALPPTSSTSDDPPSASPASGSAKAVPADPKSPAAPKAPAATADPNRPLEVPAAQKPKNPTLPKSRADGALLKLPLPAAGSTNGSLVKGFPLTVIPEMPSSAVKSSSVSPQGSILQVSLVAHNTAEPMAIMQYYQKEFAAMGLGAAQAPSVDGSTAMWFTRGNDKVTVTTTLHENGGTEYIIFGVLHAGS